MREKVESGVHQYSFNEGSQGKSRSYYKPQFPHSKYEDCNSAEQEWKLNEPGI